MYNADNIEEYANSNNKLNDARCILTEPDPIVFKHIIIKQAYKEKNDWNKKNAADTTRIQSLNHKSLGIKLRSDDYN